MSVGIDIRTAIVQAYNAQRLNVDGQAWAVKIWPMRIDESVFNRLPALATSDKLYSHPHGRYYTMMTEDLFDLIEGDILARPDAWGVEPGAVQDDVQLVIEQFFEDFVEPVE